MCVMISEYLYQCGNERVVPQMAAPEPTSEDSDLDLEAYRDPDPAAVLQD